ncbi:Predicted Zn-dependent peptidase [Seinonella peptonophila]|uniref:Predicted Zn-dependent peptidase n=1 Tax=Seinonella peptonophila TaxID=112248 RepID=A0A1M4TBP6_9BACL|nr:pitrilysin family protein [Seinonella peptonophila]SHE41825.1 Predicted Zn-dependent peptidase [Seinonella peptonophila]
MTDIHFSTTSVGSARLHVLNSKKFKTTTVVVLFEQELSEEKVTQSALLPNVLQRGTQSYPTTVQVKQKCDQLYGANLFGDVFKRGGRHFLQFGLDVANGDYLSERPALLTEGLQFLQEVLFKPVTSNDGFSSSFVNAEKKNLRQRIESLKDDKIRYAAQRLNEEMYKGEPHALYNYGQLRSLDAIDERSLYTYYQEVIQSCPIDIYCVGDVHPEEVKALFETQLGAHIGRQERPSVEALRNDQKVEQVNEIVERLEVQQGKLNLGCRTHVTIEDDLYPALMMYNGILGGFAHSKLFMNVREKASLAYYCSSRIDSYLGQVAIQSGIEIANYDQAVSIMKEQLEEMRQGNISEQEISQTKATLTNQIRERLDSAYGLIDFAHHTQQPTRKREVEQLLQEIADVTPQQIQEVAQQVELDTIYFLRDQGGIDGE